ncbi:hypothetical protein J4Q44_G00115120 [Coregonus suidteri]|uniref:Uncharacterized protein n=1 Tax=Coregonus suidteri TaxID=861788 RepID=A0AAN8M5W6_9TELE
MGHSTTNVCLWILHGCVLDVIHLSATGVAEIAQSTNLKGCPYTFGHVVYNDSKLIFDTVKNNSTMSRVRLLYMSICSYNLTDYCLLNDAALLVACLERTLKPHNADNVYERRPSIDL